MKKTLYPLLCLGLLAACQHNAPPVVKDSRKAPVLAVKLTGTKPTQAAIAPADTLTPEMLILLKQFDLAPLWAADSTVFEGCPTMDGFFGDDHYSISLFFDDVQRDAREPQLFHVQGRSRYRKSITAFKGTLRVKHIADYDSCYIPVPETDSARAYTASAAFSLQQLSQTKDTGVFSGEALLDFYITNKGDYGIPEMPVGGIIVKTTPTKGSNRLLRGIWTNSATGQVKPLLVANDLFIIAPEIYSDFAIGDRGMQVNPKYAKLGWAGFWENEEWWTDSPKPSANL